MPEFFFNGIPVSEKEMLTLLEASADAISAEELKVKLTYGVSEETASAIVYLRSRSRWTTAKEKELIERDKSGNPIPLWDVLTGEF